MPTVQSQTKVVMMGERKKNKAKLEMFVNGLCLTVRSYREEKAIESG